MTRIPIIDISKIGEIHSAVKNDEDWIKTASEIRGGLGDIGFIYLSNHGIDAKLIDDIFFQSKQFFDLPKETKLKYKKVGGNDAAGLDNHVGYAQPGEELLSPESCYEFRETFDFMDNCGKYPDEELPLFNSKITELRNECNKISKKMLVLLALALKLDDAEYFLRLFTHMDDLTLPRAGNLRALLYPSIGKDVVIPSGSFRCAEHSDYGMLTFLFQDLIGGLEVTTVDREWVPATPISGTILMNTGDLLEFWSAGIFPATRHRILIPEDEERRRAARYSVAYFLGPNVDTIVSPLKVEKTDHEIRRLAATPTRADCNDMDPVIAMEYIMMRIRLSSPKA